MKIYVVEQIRCFINSKVVLTTIDQDEALRKFKSDVGANTLQVWEEGKRLIYIEPFRCGYRVEGELKEIEEKLQ
ncbi:MULTISPECIES: hypothetical protein [Bacillus]|uniref:Uncharacterized protein n=3 Tax=Bacilli TaxID=91061 RepID=A0A7D8D716_9BACI|nr:MULTISPECIES: hypothetical protein [Bacillus]ANT40232.1 hypothetical protein [Bacillus phage PfNC7401]ANT40301.1 hypothetical protein [Bacillus phage PfIS075]EEK97187.1 hypothetical protein bcere0013_56750 [Bacillus cereus BDRD-ST26]EJP82596.1 hypothetical protein IAU_05812 [Bacillus cereus IS075]EOO82216.1 hypothetical protein IGS_05979 [Bacillus cereus IS845/00]EOO95336.1 hypothetical protein IGQ_04095 [Bacillus cereus IS195]